MIKPCLKLWSCFLVTIKRLKKKLFKSTELKCRFPFMMCDLSAALQSRAAWVWSCSAIIRLKCHFSSLHFSLFCLNRWKKKSEMRAVAAGQDFFKKNTFLHLICALGIMTSGVSVARGWCWSGKQISTFQRFDLFKGVCGFIKAILFSSAHLRAKPESAAELFRRHRPVSTIFWKCREEPLCLKATLCSDTSKKQW